MILTALTNEQLTYLIALIICAVLSVGSLGLHFFFRYRRQNSIMVRNGKPQGIWEFTKKNFWMFCFLAFFVFAFTFLMMLVK